VDAAIALRRALAERYRDALAGVPGITCLEPAEGVVGNQGYFPVFVGDDFPITRDELNTSLREHGIVTRRYFFPLIAEYPMYRGLPSASLDKLPVAVDRSRRVLCLPIYPDLDVESVERICDLIASTRAAGRSGTP
jgi:dTDP-4-amino-4,6-dideoxygalactose transaminase